MGSRSGASKITESWHARAGATKADRIGKFHLLSKQELTRYGIVTAVNGRKCHS